jgi:hypothetical protein
VRRAKAAKAGRLSLAVDLIDDEEPDEVAVFCPECWWREFCDS